MILVRFMSAFAALVVIVVTSSEVWAAAEPVVSLPTAGAGAGLVAAVWALVEVLKRREGTRKVEQAPACALDHQALRLAVEAIQAASERQADATERQTDLLVRILDRTARFKSSTDTEHRKVG